MSFTRISFTNLHETLQKATELDATRKIERLLTKEEYSIFKSALRDPNSWSEFWNNIDSSTARAIAVAKVKAEVQLRMMSVYHCTSSEEEEVLPPAPKKIKVKASEPEPPKQQLTVQRPLEILGSVSPKMKYMLETIEANRQHSGLSDRELTTLLSEVRAVGSRWADSNRIGQAELYEAMEAVLNALKAYTDHSQPFLQKVNKREAPGYYNVITNPMDLGTMTKKLKNSQYQSKKEFADDLYLIYKNCLTYNTRPDSIYREHAFKMEEKTRVLLQNPPFENKITIESKEQEITETTVDNFPDVIPPVADSDLVLKLPKVPDIWDPEIYNKNRSKLFDANVIESEERPTLDMYPEVQFSTKGTAAQVDKNIETLRQARIVQSKIAAAKQNIPVSYFGLSETAPSNSKALPQLTNINGLPPLIMNKGTGNALMERVVVKLLQHAGFEAAQSSALNVLTDVAVEYMLNLGKSLRAYCDEHDKTMTPEEILLHTLNENGVSSVNELDSYIRDEVERYGVRLSDVNRRLDATYGELLGHDDKEAGEPSLSDNDEAFAMGNFGEDIGEDFFGFKELGLGQLSVPARLFFGKDKQKNNVVKGPGQGTNAPAYPTPDPFPPVEPSKQIGLLRPYFERRASELIGLLEDEMVSQKKRSQRPKVPITGIIPRQPPRVAKPSGIEAEALAIERKRKKEREAQLAEEKKRQRMEERGRKAAKKVAEKAEKDLQRKIKAEQKRLEQESKKAEAAAKRAEQKKLKSKSKSNNSSVTGNSRSNSGNGANSAKNNSNIKTNANTNIASTSPPVNTPASTKDAISYGLSKVTANAYESDSESVPLAKRKKKRVRSDGVTVLGNRKL
ncbi:11840_t:CDS:10 [Paraglomus brasilianum]|uniref:11840_t:CDS:1 n=1 Tax=Paraglomus brasilianum TaxID=144538 RepID=A0A9N9GFQ3_9GLOM|nr:11840_t:CDS:10 [Paraglomus brasilianum]